MAVIQIPTGLAVHNFTMGQRDYSLNFQNGDTGGQQTRVLAPPRWTCSMSAALTLGPSQMVLWRTMLLQLRGGINQLCVYDMKNPVAKGTMAGTPVLTSAVAVGATSIPITTTAGATMKQGDKLQIGASATRQLVECMADAVADGSGFIVLTVEPPTRYASAGGTTINMTSPSCLMRRVDTAVSWSANAAAEGGVSVNLIESWEQ